MSKKGWVSTVSGNTLLRKNGVVVSYNDFNNSCVPSFFSSDNGCAETALIVDGSYYILNGDYREEYETLAEQGLEACVEFFKNNIEKASSWSNFPE